MMVYCDLWWWFIVNYDDDLLYLWHIIMPVMMFYCELSWFIMNWEESVICDRLVKRGGLGRFAECNTRQREELSSVKAKHSAKRPRPPFFTNLSHITDPSQFTKNHDNSQQNIITGIIICHRYNKPSS